MDYSVIDIHMHVVPNYDDGATSLDESIAMLKIAESQGVTDVFCTSHNGYTMEDGEWYKRQFALLKDRLLQEEVKVNLHQGCEILTAGECVDDVLYGIDVGAFSTLAGTKYVLIELYTDTMPSEATQIVKKVIDKGYKPIIAHMERNYNISETMVGLLIQMGALVQVNAFGFVSESSGVLKARARALLQKRYVHFIGSDAHRLNHRPPNVKSGVEYIIANADEKYAQEILNGNAKKLLLKGDSHYDE